MLRFVWTVARRYYCLWQLKWFYGATVMGFCSLTWAKMAVFPRFFRCRRHLLHCVRWCKVCLAHNQAHLMHKFIFLFFLTSKILFVLLKLLSLYLKSWAYLVLLLAYFNQFLLQKLNEVTRLSNFCFFCSQLFWSFLILAVKIFNQSQIFIDFLLNVLYQVLFR